MSAVVNTINRINQVYEAEVAVRLILVANTNLIFYYNAASDPYTNTSGDLNTNQTTITNIIGSANYDIGHLFGTGGGGVAGLGVVCSNSNKARGLTGSQTPVGDPFTIDYVAHEMGHQFRGNHTFAGNISSCGNGNRNDATSFEPGSGSSIMAYAGICSGINVQNNSDATFHAISLSEIKTFILTGTGSSCDQIVSSFINSSPTITTQNNYSIPISTPFVLTLNATDPNGNQMTYAWDQMNGVTGNVSTAPSSTNISGPMFRNILPVSSASRYFPPLSNVIANSANTWQVLPSVARTMNFRGVVRDFTGVAGCNSEIDISVSTVNAAAGAFSVTSFNTASTWATGDTKTITWNVAGSTASPVSCANVDILLSYDGGNTYPVTLASASPYDGTHNIVIPACTTTQVELWSKATIIYFLTSTMPTSPSPDPVAEVPLNSVLHHPLQVRVLAIHSIQSSESRAAEDFHPRSPYLSAVFPWVP